MDKRGEERVRSEERVLYSIGDVAKTDRLVNLSSNGCMIQSGDGVGQPDDRVEVTLLEGVVVKGRVKWARDGVLGIAFDHPLNDATIRYCEAGRMITGEHYQPTDQFGRPLPPLNGRIG